PGAPQPDTAWPLVARTTGPARRMSGAREAAAALGLRFADAPPRLPARELLAGLPMQYARRHLVLPLAPEAERLQGAGAAAPALAGGARRSPLPLRHPRRPAGGAGRGPA